MSTARLPMSEDDLLRVVIEYAQLVGVLVHHCRPALTAKGWRTPLAGDKGLPDLVLAGPRGVLFRELKSEEGRLSTDQVRWSTALAAAGADEGVWRPADWPLRIRAELEEIR